MAVGSVECRSVERYPGVSVYGNMAPGGESSIRFGLACELPSDLHGQIWRMPKPMTAERLAPFYICFMNYPGMLKPLRSRPPSDGSPLRCEPSGGLRSEASAFPVDLVQVIPVCAAP